MLEPTAVIRGDHRTHCVYIDNELLTPDRSLELMRHSPTGFCWGYGGSGPAQLALAILLECGVGDAKALSWHQRFKADVLAPLDMEQDFELNASRVYQFVINQVNEERRDQAGVTQPYAVAAEGLLIECAGLLERVQALTEEQFLKQREELLTKIGLFLGGQEEVAR